MSNTPEATPENASNGVLTPSLSILTQYIKDISFENPLAPKAPPKNDSGPAVDININVNAQKVGDDDYEVTLDFKATAKSGDTVTFIVELVYAGLFRIQNVPEQELHPVLLIEAPRQIFPFARRILADITRDGGVPPLLLDPINFAALYQQNVTNAPAKIPDIDLDANADLLKGVAAEFDEAQAAKKAQAEKPPAKAKETKAKGGKKPKA